MGEIWVVLSQKEVKMEVNCKKKKKGTDGLERNSPVESHWRILGGRMLLYDLCFNESLWLLG